MKCPKCGNFVYIYGNEWECDKCGNYGSFLSPYRDDDEDTESKAQALEASPEGAEKTDGADRN